MHSRSAGTKIVLPVLFLLEAVRPPAIVPAGGELRRDRRRVDASGYCDTTCPLFCHVALTSLLVRGRKGGWTPRTGRSPMHEAGFGRVGSERESLPMWGRGLYRGASFIAPDAKLR